MWKGLLENNRKNQLKHIANNDKSGLLELYNKMFFNELINGLWNYHYYDKNIKECSSKFLDELASFEKITGMNRESLVTNSVDSWGLGVSNGVIKYIDPSHGISAYQTLLLLDLKKDQNVLDLGSGYGGYAEKLMKYSKNRISITLIDIPLNLTTAYVYLCSIFGKDRVHLVSSKEQLTERKLGHFVLIPTILIPNLDYEFDVVHNMHSFSEMDLETIIYYLDKLTKNTSFLIETNVNIDNIADGHREIKTADFPIPKHLKLLTRFSDGIQTRHVTSIYMKVNP